MKPTVKILLLQISSFLLSIAPLIVLFIINWGDYTKTSTSTFKLTASGIVLLVIAFLNAINKMPKLKAPIKFLLLTILAWFMGDLLDDIMLIFMCAFIGSLFDLALQPKIKSLKEKLIIDKTAEETTKRIDEVITQRLDERIGRV